MSFYMGNPIVKLVCIDCEAADQTNPDAHHQVDLDMVHYFTNDDIPSHHDLDDETVESHHIRVVGFENTLFDDLDGPIKDLSNLMLISDAMANLNDHYQYIFCHWILLNLEDNPHFFDEYQYKPITMIKDFNSYYKGTENSFTDFIETMLINSEIDSSVLVNFIDVDRLADYYMDDYDVIKDSKDPDRLHIFSRF